MQIEIISDSLVITQGMSITDAIRLVNDLAKHAMQHSTQALNVLTDGCRSLWYQIPNQTNGVAILKDQNNVRFFWFAKHNKLVIYDPTHQVERWIPPSYLFLVNRYPIIPGHEPGLLFLIYPCYNIIGYFHKENRDDYQN